MAKMQPFWWFLPPPWPPSYVCWYNTCENCADWTKVGTDISCVLETILKQQGTGSLHITCPANKPADKIYIVPDDCDNYFGFWMRFPTYNVQFFVYLWSGSNYAGWVFSFSGTNLVYQVIYWVNGHTHTWPAVVISQNVWHWFEIWFNADRTNIYFTIDGVSVGSVSGLPAFGSFSKFQIENRQDYQGTNLYVDYVRIADRQEYPPV